MSANRKIAFAVSAAVAVLLGAGAGHVTGSFLVAASIPLPILPILAFFSPRFDRRDP